MVDLSEADSNKWSKLISHITKGNPGGRPTIKDSRERHDGDLWRPIKQQQRRFSAEEELDVVADFADGGTVTRSPRSTDVTGRRLAAS